MSIKITSSSLDRLDKLQKNLKDLSNTQSVPLEELLNSDFMSQYTTTNNFIDFVRNGGFTFETAEDFKKIPDDEFDKYVRENTEFKDWSEMQLSAARLWAKRKLLS